MVIAVPLSRFTSLVGGGSAFFVRRPIFMTKNNCPKCGSLDFSVLPKKGLAFQFAGDRACKTCGTVWRPGCPKWGAILSLVVGLILFVILLISGIEYVSDLAQGRSRLHEGFIVDWMLWAVFAIGFANAVVYGFRVLTGKAGLGKIISEGDSSRVAPSISPVGSASAAPQSFGRVRWFHIVAAIFVPFIALPWGLINLTREKWKSALVLIGVSIVSLALFIALLWSR